MHPERTRRFRAAIVARARFVEVLVVEQMSRSVGHSTGHHVAHRFGERLALARVDDLEIGS